MTTSEAQADMLRKAMDNIRGGVVPLTEDMVIETETKADDGIGFWRGVVAGVGFSLLLSFIIGLLSGCAHVQPAPMGDEDREAFEVWMAAHPEDEEKVVK